MKLRLPVILALSISILSGVVAGWYHDWVVVGFSIYSMLFSGFCVLKGNEDYSKCCLFSSMLILVGCLIVNLLLPYSMVGEGLDIYVWSSLVALVHSLCLPSLAFGSLFFMASWSGSSYNWAIVGALITFIGLGMVLPGFMLEYFDMIYGERELTTNGYALMSLMIPLIMMAITAVISSRRMRSGKLLIRRNGLEVRGK